MEVLSLLTASMWDPFGSVMDPFGGVMIARFQYM